MYHEVHRDDEPRFVAAISPFSELDARIVIGTPTPSWRQGWGGVRARCSPGCGPPTRTIETFASASTGCRRPQQGPDNGSVQDGQSRRARDQNAGAARLRGASFATNSRSCFRDTMTSGCRVPSCGRAFFFRFGLTRIRWIRQPVGYPTLATPNGTDNPPIKSSRAGVPASSAASSRYAHIANGMGDQTGSASSILAAAEEHDAFSSTAPRGSRGGCLEALGRGLRGARRIHSRSPEGRQLSSEAGRRL